MSQPRKVIFNELRTLSGVEVCLISVCCTLRIPPVSYSHQVIERSRNDLVMIPEHFGFAQCPVSFDYPIRVDSFIYIPVLIINQIIYP